MLENVSEEACLSQEWFDRLSAAYVTPLFEVPPYLNPHTYDVLQQLKARGKLVGLICNTGLSPGSALRRFLSESGVVEYFDLLVFSDEVGVRKPDPQIFQFVTARLGVKSSECAHIGDNLKSDVYGAKNAGFKAIFFSSMIGRDSVAESNPDSLVSISRNLGELEKNQLIPDKTVNSLDKVLEAIKEIENGRYWW